MLFRRQPKNIVDWLAICEDANSAYEDQRSNARGIADCHLRREPTSERRSDQMYAVQPQPLDDIEVEIGKIGDTIEPGRIVR